MAKTFKCFPEGTVIPTSELQVGDVVRQEGFDRPWDTCIVKKIADGMVTMFRPYGTMTDFTCGAGKDLDGSGRQVITYIGIEEYSVIQYDTREGCGWIIYQRNFLK
jgi:hypothetical protein